MGCTDPVRQCIAWHYQSKIGGVIEKDGRLRATCPSCHARRAFTARPGDYARLVWWCWNCGEDHREALRRALYLARIPARCIGDGTEETPAGLLAAIILTSPSIDAARLKLEVLARGQTEWPKGKALRELAESLGISRATAYRAKEAPVIPPGTACTNQISADLVKYLQVSPAWRAAEAVSPMRQSLTDETEIGPSRQRKVSPMRQRGQSAAASRKSPTTEETQ
jgi:hypothetical protein